MAASNYSGKDITAAGRGSDVLWGLPGVAKGGGRKRDLRRVSQGPAEDYLSTR